MLRQIRPKPPRFSGPPRVRHEPPTIREAVSAAQDLADEVEQQVAIVAGLMGLPEDEIRPHVLSAPPRRIVSRPIRDWEQPAHAPQVVVVRRRPFSRPS
jgi:hypothetical protein